MSNYTPVAEAVRTPEAIANSYRVPVKTTSQGAAEPGEVVVEFIDDHFQYTDEDGTVINIGDANNSQAAGVPITATADGLTTGLIPASAGKVLVTSANANYIVTLPASDDIPVGWDVTIHVTANGCELRTADPATEALNTVTGSGKELAMGANTVFTVKKTAADTFIAGTFSTVGAQAGGGTPD